MKTKMTSDRKNELIGLRDGILEQIRRAVTDDGASIWETPISLSPNDILETIGKYEQSVLRKLSLRNDGAYGHDDIKDLIACLAILVSMELTIAELERHELDEREICGIIRYPRFGPG